MVRPATVVVMPAAENKTTEAQPEVQPSSVKHLYPHTYSEHDYERYMSDVHHSEESSSSPSKATVSSSQPLSTPVANMQVSIEAKPDASLVPSESSVKALNEETQSEVSGVKKMLEANRRAANASIV